MDKFLQALLMTDYTAYVAYTNKGWKVSKFHRFLCETVQEFVETPTDNSFEILIISCPPQHGKSVTISETLPSWYLGRHPDRSVIEVSYNEDYALKFGRRNRMKIKEYGEVFGISMGDVDRNDEFELDGTNGGMMSRGVLTGITGSPAHLMIIDDPVKNQQEADSESRREQVWNEWLYSMRSRIQPGGKVIVILTRWHEDDIAGRMIANEKNVRVVNIPCEAEEGDILGRNIGDALCEPLSRSGAGLLPPACQFAPVCLMCGQGASRPLRPSAGNARLLLRAVPSGSSCLQKGVPLLIHQGWRDIRASL